MKTKILVVDDEVLIIEEIAEALNDEGFECLTANNVAAALKLARNTPDLCLILTDLRMPGESGLDLIAILKNEFYTKLIFIVMSGHGSTSVEDSVVTQGVTFLRKPLDIDSLIETVNLKLRSVEE